MRAWTLYPRRHLCALVAIAALAFLGWSFAPTGIGQLDAQMRFGYANTYVIIAVGVIFVLLILAFATWGKERER